MRPLMKHLIFVMFVFHGFLGGDLWAVDSSHPVEVVGDRLSVYTEGMPLGDLLMIVEEMTGVQFTFDKSVAKRKIFLDFQGLLLSEGIRKIVRPLNCASIYDEKGKLRKVFILGRWEGPDTGGSEPREYRRYEQSESESPPRKGSSGSSVSGKNPSLPKGPARVGRHSMKKPKKNEGLPNMQEPTIGAPRGTSTSKVDGPPAEQGDVMEGPPKVSDSDNSSQPPPDSGGSGTDGPPLDMPYTIDGPPDLENQGMDGPPKTL